MIHIERKLRRRSKSVGIAAVATIALALCIHGQNLANGGFETWPVGTAPPPDWGYFEDMPAGSMTVSREQVETYCGNFSAKISLDGMSTHASFGKEWIRPASTSSVDEVLRARFRVRLGGASPSGTSSGTLSFWAVDDSTGVLLGAPANVDLELGLPDWQEVEGAFTLPSPSPRARVVVALVFDDWPDLDAHVDQVDFRWSSPSLGVPDPPNALCPEPFRLSSGGLSIEVDDITGELVSLVDLQSGIELLADPDTVDNHLFWGHWQGTFPSPPDGVFFNSSDAESVSFDLSFGGDTRTLTVHHVNMLNDEMSGPVSSAVRIHADESAPGISFELEMDNTSDGYVEEVRAPRLRLAPEILDPESSPDRVFVPNSLGVEVGSGSVNSGKIVGEYPGRISMQFLAYYDDLAGIAMWTPDGEGHPKQIGYDGKEEYVELRTTLRRPWVLDRGIASGEAPPVVLHPTRGGWMEFAKIYREWAKLQDWWVPTLGTSTSVDWMVHRPLCYSANIRPSGPNQPTTDPSQWIFIAPIDLWDDVLGSWAMEIGGPTIGMFRHWERYGNYLGPYYTPFDTPWHTRDQIRSLWLDTLSTGNHTAAMVATLKWMIERPLDPECADWTAAFDGQIEDPSGALISTLAGGGDNDLGLTYPPAADVVAWTKLGVPYVEEGGSEWDGDNHKISTASPFATQLHVALAEYMAERGVQLYELDQMAGGGTQVDYHPDRSYLPGGEPGYGTWMYESVLELLRQTRAAGRAVSSDFGIAMETPNELFIPQVDVWWLGADEIDEWPALGEGTDSRVVPAFQFVYGSVSPTLSKTTFITSPLHPSAGSTEAVTNYRIARSFAFGSWLSIQVREHMLLTGPTGQDDCRTIPNLPEPSNTTASHVDLLKNATDSLEVAAEFFNHGEMVSTSGEIVPTAVVPEPGLLRQMPRVVHSAWQWNGATLLVIVNPANSAATIDQLPTHFDGVAVPPATTATIRRYKFPTLPPTTTGYLGVGSLTLSAQEVVLVVL